MKMPMIDDNLDNPTASNQKYKKVNIRKENYGFIIFTSVRMFHLHANWRRYNEFIFIVIVRLKSCGNVLQVPSFFS